ncbi:MAG: hypothetical protein WCT10_01245 [Patescibacteria group bacterium]|jgi:hypothetical protein
MLGKPEWFQRRKYGGWGYCPKSWQGWVYVAAIVAPIFLIQYLPFGGAEEWRFAALFIWGAIITADAIHIMANMTKDERERAHEALAERNALWAMIIALCAGVGYQAAAGIVRGEFTVDPVILAALFAGVIAKAATNIYLDRKN